ncbi:MAG: hypothetical protein K5656_02935 [Lachnospiraceae bacterium]|nr:hypothetical protein [Lachnospiraceae bacterium]
MRFDPYTGEPIPDEPSNDTVNNDAPTEVPTEAPNQPEANVSEPSPSYDSQPQNGSYNASEQAPSFDSQPNTGSYNASEQAYQQANDAANQGSPYGAYNSAAQGQPYNQQGQAYNQQGQAYNQQAQGYSNYSNSSQGYSNNSSGQYNPYNGQSVNNTNTVDLDEKGGKSGTAAIICGIISIVTSFLSFCCCPIISIGTGIAAIICGVNAKDAAGNRVGTGKAGIITGIIGLVFTVLIMLFFLIGIFTGGGSEDFWEEFQKGYNMGKNYNFNLIEASEDVSFDGISIDDKFIK